MPEITYELVFDGEKMPFNTLKDVYNYILDNNLQTTKQFNVYRNGKLIEDQDKAY